MLKKNRYLNRTSKKKCSREQKDICQSWLKNCESVNRWITSSFFDDAYSHQFGNRHEWRDSREYVRFCNVSDIFTITFHFILIQQSTSFFYIPLFLVCIAKNYYF